MDERSADDETETAMLTGRDFARKGREGEGESITKERIERGNSSVGVTLGAKRVCTLFVLDKQVVWRPRKT